MASGNSFRVFLSTRLTSRFFSADVGVYTVTFELLSTRGHIQNNRGDSMLCRHIPLTQSTKSAMQPACINRPSRKLSRNEPINSFKPELCSRQK